MAYEPRALESNNKGLKDIVKISVVLLLISFLVPKIMSFIVNLRYIEKVVRYTSQGAFARFSGVMSYMYDFVDVGRLKGELQNVTAMDAFGLYLNKMYDFWGESAVVVGQFLEFFESGGGINNL